MSKPPPLSLVAKALLGALAEPPALTGLTLALSQSIGEGSWNAWQEGGDTLYAFEGTNNFGAIHATHPWASAHANDPGYGMVAFTDHNPGPYVTRMAVFPTMTIGAKAFLSLVGQYADLDTVTSATDFAAQLYVHNYFEGFQPGRTPVAERAAAYKGNTWNAADITNIADYAALITRNQPAARAALVAATSELGDPDAPTHGPPFAPLSLRLTPAQKYAPHTLAHAREVLGMSGVNPSAGNISIADALAAPLGDGVWLFPDGVYAPANPEPAPPAPVSRVVAEEAAGVAVVVGTMLGLAASAAVIHWRPDWIPSFGARA